MNRLARRGILRPIALAFDDTFAFLVDRRCLFGLRWNGLGGSVRDVSLGFLLRLVHDLPGLGAFKNLDTQNSPAFRILLNGLGLELVALFLHGVEPTN
jgi:hypothetical protein